LNGNRYGKWKEWGNRPEENKVCQQYAAWHGSDLKERNKQML